MTQDSIAPVPEVVKKTQREFFGAYIYFRIRLSFSFMISENSGVRKYGADLPPTFNTTSSDITGPTVKFNIQVSFIYS
jgi:hypothetical protein